MAATTSSARAAGRSTTKGARRTAAAAGGGRPRAQGGKQGLAGAAAGLAMLVAGGLGAGAPPACWADEGAPSSALVAQLLERSAANKDANNKHRRMTFDANLARTRTVTDNTCKFPNNFFGCENYAEVADVKFISDDLKQECSNTPDGKVCRSKVKNSFPSFLGL